MEWEYTKFVEFIREANHDEGFEISIYDLLEYCRRKNFNEKFKINNIWNIVSFRGIDSNDFGFDEERLEMIDEMYFAYLKGENLSKIFSEILSRRKKDLFLQFFNATADGISEVDSEELLIEKEQKLECSLEKNKISNNYDSIDFNLDLLSSDELASLTDDEMNMHILSNKNFENIDKEKPFEVIVDEDDHVSDFMHDFLSDKGHDNLLIIDLNENSVNKDRYELIEVNRTTHLLRERIFRARVTSVDVDSINCIENLDDIDKYLKNVLCKLHAFININEATVLILNNARPELRNFFNDYNDLKKHLVKFTLENDLEVVEEDIYLNEYKVTKDFEIKRKSYDEKNSFNIPSWLIAAREFWKNKLGGYIWLGKKWH